VAPLLIYGHIITLLCKGTGTEDSMSTQIFKVYTPAYSRLVLRPEYPPGTGQHQNTSPSSASPEQTPVPVLQDCPETWTKAREKEDRQIPFKSTLLMWTKTLMEILPYDFYENHETLITSPEKQKESSPQKPL